MGNFDNIIGYRAIVRELEIILDIICNKEKYEKLNANVPSGLVLNGPAGTGKSTLAKDFMKASGRKEFILHKTQADGSFIDEIRNTVEDAIANAPSIVLFDDIDKFSDAREEDRDAEEFVVCQSMIDKAKGHDVFFLATTNKLYKLPRSLTRAQRLNRIIDVPYPCVEDAELIIAHYLADKPNVGDVDNKLLAKLLDGKSCADLEMVINEAAIKTGYDNRDKISMDDLVKTILDLIFHSVHSEKEKTPYFKRVAAIHEAGHAVANEVLEPGSVDLISIANYSSEIGGITSCSMNEDYFTNIKFMENRVMTLLSGKAATDVILGIKDTGANSDIHRAFDISERFVDHYCSNGFDTFERESSGMDLRDKKSSNLAFTMELFYQKAKELIYTNREFVEKLAKRLEEKEYILSNEIKEIKDSCKIVA